MIRIQPDDFNLQAELEQLQSRAPGAGAVVSFLGLVRDLDHGSRIDSLYLEHYPGMTESSIGAIVQEASSRWSVMDSTVIHRVGELRASEQIVMVAVASAHRKDAFEACEFIIDFLKTRSPIWKKERTEAGSSWVASRKSDFETAAGWGESPPKGGK